MIREFPLILAPIGLPRKARKTLDAIDRRHTTALRQGDIADLVRCRRKQTKHPAVPREIERKHRFPI